MEIGGSLHNNLATLIAGEVNIAEKYEGRDVLLAGIVNQNGWTRSHDNKRIDIFHIIEYLKHHFVGDRETIETWGLIIFIDNAIREAEGTATARKLQELRQQCIQCWEQRHQDSPRLAAQSPANHDEPSAPSPSLSEQTPMSDSSASQEHLLLEDSECSGEQAFSHFFEQASFYVAEMQKEVTGASKPFKELAQGDAEPVECREAIDHLTSSLEQLRLLFHLLKTTSPLPNKTLAPHRRRFLEHIQYLTEQIQKLMEWIDNNATTKTIKEKFSIIEKALQVFDIFNKGKGSSGDTHG